jgi:hypothetical protein
VAVAECVDVAEALEDAVLELVAVVDPDEVAV